MFHRNWIKGCQGSGFLFLALLLSGCHHTFEEKKGAVEATPPVLTSASRIYIGRPIDVLFKEKVVHNSGQTIAESLLVAFSRNTKAAAMARRPQSIPEALEAANQFRADFMVYPVILKWEDRATEMSGRRDKLNFRLDLYDVGTGQVIYAKEFDAKSRWMTDGGDSPRDLMQPPIDLYVQQLFRRIERPSSLY